MERVLFLAMVPFQGPLPSCIGFYDLQIDSLNSYQISAGICSLHTCSHWSVLAQTWTLVLAWWRSWPYITSTYSPEDVLCSAVRLQGSSHQSLGWELWSSHEWTGSFSHICAPINPVFKSNLSPDSALDWELVSSE